MFTDAAERPTNEQLRHYMKRFQKQIGKKSKSKIPSFLGQLSFFQIFTAQAELVLLPNQTVPNYVAPVKYILAPRRQANMGVSHLSQRPGIGRKISGPGI